jgi:drug/metabolite transporter (DMT)-like permease
MTPQRRAALLPTLLLLAVTAVWGSTFPLTKHLIAHVPAADYLAVRFLIAGVVLAGVAHRSLRRLPRQLLGRGVVAGLVYGVAQLLQTEGLAHTSATVSGFLTGLYVVLTPLLAALILGTRLGPTTWVAVVLATVGLAFLSLQGASVGTGEAITAASAVLYALHIVALGAWSRPEHALGLSAVQLLVIALTCLAVTAPGGVVLPATSHDWSVLLYLAMVSGLLGMVAQTWSQAHLPPTRAAIIMTMEPVFATLFAVGLGDDRLTLRTGIGCLVVLAAMVLAEAGPRRKVEVEVPHLAQ